MITINLNSKWDCCFIYWPYKEVTYYTTSLHYMISAANTDTCAKPLGSKGFGRYSIHLSLHFRTHLTHFLCSTPSYSHHFHFHFRCKLHSSVSNPDCSSAIHLALRYGYSTYNRNPPFFPVSILLEHPHTVKASAEVESRRWGSCLELNLKVQSN